MATFLTLEMSRVSRKNLITKKLKDYSTEGAESPPLVFISAL